MTSLVSLLGGLLLREPLFEYFETESSSEDDERAGPEGWDSGICDDEEDCEGEELPEDLIDDAIYGDFDMAPWKAFNKFYTRFDPSKKKSHRGALQKGFTCGGCLGSQRSFGLFVRMNELSWLLT